MYETKEGFLEICLTSCMLSFSMSYYGTEAKAKTLHFYFQAKSRILTQRPFRACFKVEACWKLKPSRSTISYLTEKYLGGWCVSIPQKTFSGRKKQVITAEKVRLFRTFVNNDPMKSHRRGRAPWAAWASMLPAGWKMPQGRCTILLQKDVSLDHADTVTMKRLQKWFGERFIARDNNKCLDLLYLWKEVLTFLKHKLLGNKYGSGYTTWCHNAVANIVADSTPAYIS